MRLVCDDKDPPWINIQVKSLVPEKNKAFYKNDNESFSKFQLHQEQLVIEIKKFKQIYYS